MILVMNRDDIEEWLSRFLGALEDPTAADWIGAIAAALTFVIAGIALLYARGQVAEARASRKLAQELEVERAQPYVVAYSEPSGATQVIIDLVVKNYGATAATDVRISLDPWPMRSVAGGQPERVEIPEVIPVLAPGQEWRTMWDSGLTRQSSSLPDRHEGKVTFRGIKNTARESDVVLDWTIYKTRQWVEVRGIHDAAVALREMKTIMKKWNESVHGALRVYVRDGGEKDREESARHQAWLNDTSASPKQADKAEDSASAPKVQPASRRAPRKSKTAD